MLCRIIGKQRFCGWRISGAASQCDLPLKSYVPLDVGMVYVDVWAKETTFISCPVSTLSLYFFERSLCPILSLFGLSLSTVPLCHRRNKGARERKWQGEKESWAKQGEREGRQLQTSNKFWSKFRSGWSGYEVCFKQKSPPPSFLMPQFSLPLGLLSSFAVPHASIFFSHLLQPQPHPSISLRPRGALCFTLFASYTPLSHSALLLASFTHPLHPPWGPLLPLSPQLMKGGINEGVHVNLWWPLLTSFNQSGESQAKSSRIQR